MNDLKPETIAAIREAFEAARRAILALTDDPGRDGRFEGGAIFGATPDRRHAALQLTVRPGVADDIDAAYGADLERVLP